MNNTDKNILLLEKNDRVGGRSFTLNLKYRNEMKIHIENCAMRFYWRHQYMNKLLYHFDACDQIVPFSSYDNQTTQDPMYDIRNNVIYESQFDYDHINSIYQFSSFDRSIIDMNNESYSNPNQL